nr:hypothetical protein [Bradyrhizobium sp. 2S1]
MLNLRPANPEARARGEKLGFVEVDADNMVLDPEMSENWIRTVMVNGSEKALPRDIFPKLATVRTVIPRSTEGSATYDCEDDFM